jgi:hypothetical protein
VPFAAWLLSPNLMFVRFIHIVSCSSGLRDYSVSIHSAWQAFRMIPALGC